jgi:hypothetical protein
MWTPEGSTALRLSNHWSGMVVHNSKWGFVCSIRLESCCSPLQQVDSLASATTTYALTVMFFLFFCMSMRALQSLTCSEHVRIAPRS